MKIYGVLLLAVGFAIAIVAFLLPTTVETYSSGILPERVVNISKLQTQTLVFATGAVLFLAGAILMGAGEIAERLERIELAAPAQRQAAPPQASADSSEDPLAHVARWDDASGMAVASKPKDAYGEPPAGYIWAAGIVLVVMLIGMAMFHLKGGPSSTPTADTVPTENIYPDTMVTNIDAVVD